MASNTLKLLEEKEGFSPGSFLKILQRNRNVTMDKKSKNMPMHRHGRNCRRLLASVPCVTAGKGRARNVK